MNNHSPAQQGERKLPVPIFISFSIFFKRITGLKKGSLDILHGFPIDKIDCLVYK